MRLSFDIKSRIFGAYVVVLALGVVLATLVYLAGGQVQRLSRDLVERDIPKLQAIAQLKLDIAAQESVLFRYDLFRDRAQFLREYERIEGVCAAGLDQLGGQLGGDERLEALRGDYLRLTALARGLDQLFSAAPVDEAGARTALEQASVVARRIRGGLDDIAISIETQAREAGARAAGTAQEMQWRVVWFAGAIFLVSLAVGYYINAFINEQAARRRLAMFPERNPNPVLSLSPRGEVVYANPAAGELLRATGATELRGLLPPDLDEHLDALKQAPLGREMWRYPLDGGRAVECVIQWFDDLEVFHAYVADVTERDRAQERLIHQAYHDTLTGLPNRRLFQERLEETLAIAAEAKTRIAVLMLGLDRTRALIAGLGHAAGDALLAGAGARLGAQLARASDVAAGATVYRFEGDRFVVLVPDVTSPKAPVRLAERLLAALAEPFYLEGREHHASVSVGISVYPRDGVDSAALLRNTETAMQLAKQAGGGSLRSYTHDMNEHAGERLALENELRHAERHGELRLVFQPQVDIRSSVVVGAEALLRWEHPRLGMLSPGQFLTLAEESGMVVPLGDWVLRNACVQCAAWRAHGSGEIVVAVNISSKQFAQPDIARRVKKALDKSKLAPDGLELEITESVAMYDVERTAATLRELRDIGVRVSLDDFGTGFSSLSYLKQFAIDKLKIDQSFVRNLVTDAADAAITRAVIELGHGLQLRVLAEGVETREQLARLRELNCDEWQGYLYGAPISAEIFAAALADAASPNTRGLPVREV